MSLFLDLVREAKNNPVSLPFLIPVDDKLKITGLVESSEWDALTLISEVKHDTGVVCEYAENETQRGGWIVKVGFPKFAAERWTWVLVRGA